MLLSMTGFGKARKQNNDMEIVVEIRSLNSKNQDIKIRIPSGYKEKETDIRSLILNKLIRGKIDINLQIEDLSGNTLTKINPQALQSYLAQLKQIKPNIDENLAINSIIRLPDVLKTEEKELDEKLWKAIKNVVEEAIEQLINFRLQEGKSIEKDLHNNILFIQKKLQTIVAEDENRIKTKKEKIRSELEKLKMEIDENRFEQELIYYIEKFDINEEIIRLKNHLDYFINQLNSEQMSKGKKLGFIAQEIGREINTIGSKANDSIIQKSVVEMKDALEKIKEQVLNVL